MRLDRSGCCGARTEAAFAPVLTAVNTGSMSAEPSAEAAPA